jgi:hypothetical protein
MPYPYGTTNAENQPAGLFTGDPPPPQLNTPTGLYSAGGIPANVIKGENNEKGIGKGGKRDEKKGKEKGYMQKR